jgi:hypothetical protein
LTSLIPDIFAGGFFATPEVADNGGLERTAGGAGETVANARRTCSSVDPVGGITFCRLGAGPLCCAAMTVAAFGLAGKDGCTDGAGEEDGTGEDKVAS